LSSEKGVCPHYLKKLKRGDAEIGKLRSEELGAERLEPGKK
jgi:hypothetical protein